MRCSLTSAYFSTSTMLKSCFAAGTPLLTPNGEKRIEDFKPGDWIMSAPEDDANAPAEAQQVEEVFYHRSGIARTSNGRRVRTAEEHPFFVQDKG
jgi:intein/homing endonuclease